MNMIITWNGHIGNGMQDKQARRKIARNSSVEDIADLLTRTRPLATGAQLACAGMMKYMTDYIILPFGLLAQNETGNKNY